jgi:hypothetical protein
MISDSNNWLYAAVVFAPLMALGARVVYVVAKVIWKESVGEEMTISMRRSCVEGLALGVYGLVVALILQQLFGRDVMARYLAIVTMIMGILAGGWSGHRWKWLWRTAGYSAVLFLACYASLIG